mmetsp:Transcript_52125/g.59543  ORF Transcript_52125/g.59543 Transcript_52125/m.59543 type:complete len:406 (-) Transcript_52125:415-1632(-)
MDSVLESAFLEQEHRKFLFEVEEEFFQLLNDDSSSSVTLDQLTSFQKNLALKTATRFSLSTEPTGEGCENRLKVSKEKASKTPILKYEDFFHDLEESKEPRVISPKKSFGKGCMNSISEPRRNNVVTQSGGHLNSSNSVPQFKGRGNTKWGGEHCSAQNREEDGVTNEGPQRPRFYNSKSKRGNNKSEENTNRYKYQSKGQTNRGSSFKRSHHQGGEGSLTWRPKIYQPESSVFKYDSASATPEKGTDRETQDVAKDVNKISEFQESSLQAGKAKDKEEKSHPKWKPKHNRNDPQHHNPEDHKCDSKPQPSKSAIRAVSYFPSINHIVEAKNHSKDTTLQQGLKTLDIKYKTIKHVDDNIYVVIFDSRQQAEDAVECSVVGSGGGVHLRPLSRSSHELKYGLLAG